MQDTSTETLINDLFNLRQDKTLPPRVSLKIGHAIARIRELENKLGAMTGMRFCPDHGIVSMAPDHTCPAIMTSVTGDGPCGILIDGKAIRRLLFGEAIETATDVANSK